MLLNILYVTWQVVQVSNLFLNSSLAKIKKNVFFTYYYWIRKYFELCSPSTHDTLHGDAPRVRFSATSAYCLTHSTECGNIVPWLVNGTLAGKRIGKQIFFLNILLYCNGKINRSNSRRTLFTICIVFIRHRYRWIDIFVPLKQREENPSCDPTCKVC